MSDIALKIGAFLESRRVVNSVILISIGIAALILIAMAWLALHPIGKPQVEAYRYVPAEGNPSPNTQTQ